MLNLLRYCVVVGFLTLSAGSDIQVSRVKRDSATNGVVIGYNDCGSQGTVTELRISGCEMVPCHFFPGNRYAVEIDFVSSRRYPQVNLKIFLTEEDGRRHSLYDVPVEGEINPGEITHFSLAFPATDVFSGQTVNLQFEIWGYDFEEAEICLNADARIQ